LTGRALALRLGWPGSKISRIETGKQHIAAAEVEAWAVAVGLSPAAQESLVAESRQTHFEYAAWRNRLRSGTARQQRANMGLDPATSSQWVFEPDIVPGLLQTPDYARAVLRHVVAFDELPDDVEEGVRTRLRRQSVLDDTGKRFQFLVGEAALRYRICPPAVFE
jgi:hypothetical protein